MFPQIYATPIYYKSRSSYFHQNTHSAMRTICGNQFKIFAPVRWHITCISTDRDISIGIETKKICGKIQAKKNLLSQTPAPSATRTICGNQILIFAPVRWHITRISTDRDISIRIEIEKSVEKYWRKKNLLPQTPAHSAMRTICGNQILILAPVRWHITRI